MKCAAIIVAAGSSRRMGFDKLMHPLAGKAVLQHSLDAFQNNPAISKVVVVTSLHRFELLDTRAHVESVEGGAERHLSVMAGLNCLHPEIELVAVHDGARPLISAEQIEKVTTAAKEHGAASSAKHITDTVKRSTAEHFTHSSISRENLWAMETPQVFHKSHITSAYEHVIRENLLVTDEVSALEHLSLPTKLIYNTTPNPTITFPEDIQLAETLSAL